VIRNGTDSTDVPGNLDVASIGGRADWYVDGVELRFRNGAVHIYGGNGGNAQPLEELDAGEVIVAVEQRNLQVGHLGSALLFHLSSGRTITVSGQFGNKKCKQKKTYEAPRGHLIHELVFKGCELVDVVTAVRKR